MKTDQTMNILPTHIRVHVQYCVYCVTDRCLQVFLTLKLKTNFPPL